MNKYDTLLTVGNENNSLSITYDGSNYFYYTDKFTDSELAQRVSEPTHLKTRALKFNSFEEAFHNMLRKYDVFNLYPHSIHPDYFELVRNLFDMKKASDEQIDNKRLRRWEMFFNNEAFDYNFEQIKDRKPDYAASDSALMMPLELKLLIEKQLLADLAFYKYNVKWYKIRLVRMYSRRSLCGIPKSGN